MIFFEGFKNALVIARQELAHVNTTKTCKIAKKSFIFLAQTPCFSSKTAKK